MTDDTKNKIEQLEKELYSKDFQPHRVDDGILHKELSKVTPVWEDKQSEATRFAKDLADEKMRKIKFQKIVKKFVSISIGFFALAAVVSGFLWLRGGNTVSGDNIIIDTSLPVAVAGGEPFKTTFTVSNNNKVPIEEATLFIEYPAGFYSPATKEDLLRTTKTLGTINPGQMIAENIDTFVYGEENTKKEVNLTLEYRITGSNATLRKFTTYSVKILSSPVKVSLNMLKEASSGQEVEMTLGIDSNSQTSLRRLLLEASYPSGFIFKSAEPAPSSGNNFWDIDTLETQEKRVFKIKGVMSGQEGEEKIVKISIGTKSANDGRSIGVVYNTVDETLVIKRPFLGLDLTIDGDSSPEHSVPYGKGVRVDIAWQNNNPTKITDAVIEVKIKGMALNRYSIAPSMGGFYRSSDDTIIWEKMGNPELAVIEPGGRGRMNFNFSPKLFGVDTGSIIKNQEIVIEVGARARRTSDANVSENVTTFMMRKVRVETNVYLSVRGLYFSGPFSNSGPLPPRVDQETTYTIVWTVRNTSNDISNIFVKTTLPLYVKWLGKISPEDEDISYNENESSVMWSAGRIPSGGTREAAFQISFLPSLSQLGQTPLLTGEYSLTVFDDFTKTEVSDRKPSVKIALPSDPQFSENQGVVVQ
ncbi:MAG: hypothetical protein HY228_00745 [Candidatus Yonathbacteria bacterium]|nr:hypothetical protein [Candidatus Yonathbacteria bacterium]